MNLMFIEATIMYRYNSSKTALVISGAITLLLTALSNPAVSQINFTDLNQSRQFFDQGRQNFQQEIDRFKKDEKLPEIRLPENYNEPQEIDDLSYIYKQQKLNLILTQEEKIEIDDYLFNL